MVIALQYTPVVLSYFLLAAHFFRADAWLSTVVFLFFPMFLLVPAKGVARAAQVLLLLGAGEWIYSICELILERQALGQPYLRMVIILGGVTAFFIASVFSFYLPAPRRNYFGSPPPKSPEGGLPNT